MSAVGSQTRRTQLAPTPDSARSGGSNGGSSVGVGGVDKGSAAKVASTSAAAPAPRVTWWARMDRLATFLDRAILQSTRVRDAALVTQLCVNIVGMLAFGSQGWRAPASVCAVEAVSALSHGVFIAIVIRRNRMSRIRLVVALTRLALSALCFITSGVIFVLLQDDVYTFKIRCCSQSLEDCNVSLQ
ncbi:hypothetical protein HK405_006237, partial [Cladochytrium tenue]